MAALPRPPVLPRWILAQTLGNERFGESVLGDLHEEFVTRSARSPARAYWIYWRDALAVAGRYLLKAWRRRIVARRKRPLLEPIMDQFLLNTRYAIRRLVRSPFFTLTAILSLGLGIGANTAMFSLVNAVILRDVPFENVESLIDVYVEQEGFSHATLSYPDYADLRDGSGQVFSEVSASVLALLQADTESGVEILPGEAVTGNYFSLIGVRPAVGRLLSEEDDVAPGAHPVVVLGYGYWKARYGEDPGIVGSEIRLAGRPYTVIGVAPESYQGNLRGIVPQAYVPIMMFDELQGVGGDALESRGSQNLFVKARLRPGVNTVQARAVVDRISHGFRAEYPRIWTPEKKLVLESTADVIMNPMVDRVIVPAAGMIMAVVGLVLIIACANLASFLLARAADRRKEIAVRLAMGAKRRTLVGQLLTETLILSGLGGALGIGLALWSLRALLSTDLPLPIPITLDLSLDGTVLGFSLVVTAAAGVFFGLAPAIQGTNPDVAPTLRDESTGGGRGRAAGLRNLLVIGQVAVSVVLLVSAGLLTRSLLASSRVDPGFGEDPTGLLQVIVSSSRYSESEGLAFTDQLVDRLETLPGVVAVGLTDDLHLNNLNTQTRRISVEGVSPPEGREGFSIDYARIDEGFLDAAGIPLLEGRDFDRTDAAEAQPVAIVNQTFARRFFSAESPVGRTIGVNDQETLVVGVARDTKIRSLGETPRPFIYLPYRQSYSAYVAFLARTTVDADITALEMLAAARELDPELMVVDAKTVERHIAIQLLPRRLGASVVAGFALLALILASIGLYGVVSYAVAQRSREVGIRLSLGAQSGTVVWMLTSGGMKLVLIGGGLGLVVAALLAQLLASLLYGVAALDVPTFLGVPAVLGAVALLASWFPARRASRVNPVAALKSQ